MITNPLATSIPSSVARSKAFPPFDEIKRNKFAMNESMEHARLTAARCGLTPAG